MKLIIQIPAFNEEKTLPLTLSQLPTQINGIKTIETLVIDDGSTDNTVNVAHQNGVNHIVQLHHNQGLAAVFRTGLETCLKLGADIIVNTDADNQYCAQDIEKLIQPILNRTHDIVIGERPIFKTPHFSFLKKILQRLGSSVVQKISNTSIPDAPSGFRAISRKAAFKINIFSNYTYTLEMIIQAGKKGISITSVPVRTNKEERPSRLFKSMYSYIYKSLLTMFRILNTYQPLSFFIKLGLIPFTLGCIIGIRWIILFMGKGNALHIPSLILTSILILISFLFFSLGLLADLISVNRKLLEDIQLRLKHLTISKDT